MSALTTRRWSVEEWLASETAWDGLLARSKMDALFLSWQWLTRWWRWYGTMLNLAPDIMAFYRGDSLVGIAPLYRRRVLRAGVLVAQSVQLIGLSWRDPVPLVSEYLDVIAPVEDRDAVRNACIRALLDEPVWSELVIGFTEAGGKWREAFSREASEVDHYTREIEHSASYHADLAHGFAAYLRDLGQSTRRHVWNMRRRLAEEHGAVSLEFLSGSEIEHGFEELNRLHRLRWQRPAFAGERLEFHKSFAARLAAHGELAFTRLRVAGSVVSMLYDIRKGPRQYNIKTGFDPAFTNRLSLGLIHFGYAMEAAAERGVTLYDFLAGPGQTYDFKRNLAQVRRDLSSVQMLRGRVLPALYRWHDRTCQHAEHWPQ